METEIITIAPTDAGTLTITYGEQVVASMRDGARISQRADQHLLAIGVRRATGYAATTAGLQAQGVALR